MTVMPFMRMAQVNDARSGKGKFVAPAACFDLLTTDPKVFTPEIRDGKVVYRALENLVLKPYPLIKCWVNPGDTVVFFNESRG